MTVLFQRSNIFIQSFIVNAACSYRILTFTTPQISQGFCLTFDSIKPMDWILIADAWMPSATSAWASAVVSIERTQRPTGWMICQHNSARLNVVARQCTPGDLTILNDNARPATDKTRDRVYEDLPQVVSSVHVDSSALPRHSRGDSTSERHNLLEQNDRLRMSIIKTF